MEFELTEEERARVVDRVEARLADVKNNKTGASQDVVIVSYEEVLWEIEKRKRKDND